MTVIRVITLMMLFISGQSCFAARDSELTLDARNLSDWIISSSDNQDLPYIIIDKKESKVFIFSSDGKISGSTTALIGVTIGDDIAPGVGKKKLADIKIEERTTPAGRFQAQLGSNPNKSELLWIDYDSGLSMHPVVTSNPLEHRLQRLLNPNVSEHRITYGCINVASTFYSQLIHPTFKDSSGFVYILPEIHSILSVFGPEAYRFSLRE